MFGLYVYTVMFPFESLLNPKNFAVRTRFRWVFKPLALCPVHLKIRTFKATG